jgi:hypothetical protein
VDATAGALDDVDGAAVVGDEAPLLPPPDVQAAAITVDATAAATHRRGLVADTADTVRRWERQRAAVPCDP